MADFGIVNPTLQGYYGAQSVANQTRQVGIEAQNSDTMRQQMLNNQNQQVFEQFHKNLQDTIESVKAIATAAAQSNKDPQRATQAAIQAHLPFLQKAAQILQNRGLPVPDPNSLQQMLMSAASTPTAEETATAKGTAIGKGAAAQAQAVSTATGVPITQALEGSGAIKAPEPLNNMETALLASGATPEQLSSRNIPASIAQRAINKLMEMQTGIPGSMGGGNGGPAIGQVDEKTGRNEGFLKTLNPSIATTVKALADGRMALPAGFALKAPYWQTMLRMLGTYDPSFDFANAGARAATRKSFSAGPDAEKIRAFNQVTGHISQLANMADALGNKNMRTYNTIANALATEFGWKGKTDFDTVAPKVAQELTRAWRGAGGSEADISRDLQALNSSNSPQQLQSSLKNLVGMISTGLDSLESKYQQGMGTTSQPLELVNPEAKKARAMIDALNQKLSGADVTQPIKQTDITQPGWSIKKL